MRKALLILMLFTIPQWAGADKVNPKHKAHHQKKVPYTTLVKHHYPKSRYKLVTVFKNGKQIHRYVEIHPAKHPVLVDKDKDKEAPGILPASDTVIAREPAQEEFKIREESQNLQVERELDSNP